MCKYKENVILEFMGLCLREVESPHLPVLCSYVVVVEQRQQRLKDSNIEKSVCTIKAANLQSISPWKSISLHVIIFALLTGI